MKWEKFCLRLHYSGSNSYLFVNRVEVYQFKAKDSDLVIYLLFLGNISKDFSVNIMKQTGLNRYVYGFSVDFWSIDVGNILDIHKYLIKKPDIKYLLDFLKNIY